MPDFAALPGAQPRLIPPPPYAAIDPASAAAAPAVDQSTCASECCDVLDFVCSNGGAECCGGLVVPAACGLLCALKCP